MRVNLAEENLFRFLPQLVFDFLRQIPLSNFQWEIVIL